jgi:hypothetical protein
MTPSHARAESEIEPANAIDSATSPTIRRSNISAMAPAGVDTSATRCPRQSRSMASATTSPAALGPRLAA